MKLLIHDIISEFQNLVKNFGYAGPFDGFYYKTSNLKFELFERSGAPVIIIVQGNQKRYDKIELILLEDKPWAFFSTEDIPATYSDIDDNLQFCLFKKHPALYNYILFAVDKIHELRI